MVVTVSENRNIAKNIYLMRFFGDVGAVVRPGQFVGIKIDGLYLRRPFSVLDWQDGILSIAYKTVGKGTDAMAKLQPGDTIDALFPLGNGYDMSKSGNVPLLVGGGCGAAALLLLCKQLLAAGAHPTVVLGVNSADEDFCSGWFLNLGAQVELTSLDGSCGTKGVVTDCIDVAKPHSFIYSCGPMGMMKAVSASCPLAGQFSLEERMGCGFGACLGCTILTMKGLKRVCTDGPVFNKEDILW